MGEDRRLSQAAKTQISVTSSLTGEIGEATAPLSSGFSGGVNELMHIIQ